MKKIEFYSLLTSQHSENFKKKVIKLMPIEVKSLALHRAYMERIQRNSYNFCLECDINGILITFKAFTHDSMAWDDWYVLENNSRAHDNWKKNVALAILERRKDEIKNHLQTEEQ